MATYSTATAVRIEAGMVGNTNLVDATHITPLNEEAYSEIRSRIGSRYSLASLTTGFTGSDAETLLKRIETILAAGYLLQREYPQETAENDAGNAKVTRGMDMIDAIISGDAKLYDINGEEYSLRGSTKSGSTIRTTCPAWDDTDRPAQFSTHQVF